jgi:hypothetical protein
MSIEFVLFLLLKYNSISHTVNIYKSILFDKKINNLNQGRNPTAKVNTGLDRPIGSQKVEVRLYPFPRSRRYSWYSFLSEADSTPGPQCGRKKKFNKNPQ